MPAGGQVTCITSAEDAGLELGSRMPCTRRAAPSATWRKLSPHRAAHLHLMPLPAPPPPGRVLGTRLLKPQPCWWVAAAAATGLCAHQVLRPSARLCVQRSPLGLCTPLAGCPFDAGCRSPPDHSPVSKDAQRSFDPKFCSFPLRSPAAVNSFLLQPLPRSNFVPPRFLLSPTALPQVTCKRSTTSRLDRAHW